MAFWQTTDVEPKRGYRFILSIPGFPQYIIKSVKKPSFTIGKTPHQYLNHTFTTQDELSGNRLISPLSILLGMKTMEQPN